MLNTIIIFFILVICIFMIMNKNIEGFDRSDLIGVDNYDNYEYTYLGNMYKNSNSFYSRLINPIAYFAGDIYGTYGNPHYTWNTLNPYYPNQNRQQILGW